MIQELYNLAARYKNTHVTEYEGRIYIRNGRHTIAVVDPVIGAILYKPLHSTTERARLRQVEAIVWSTS